jgi:lipopolysaccharide transport system ATP-binding protein
MSSDEMAIQVSNLSKCYQIYSRPQDRLKQSIVPRVRRLFGRPAPDYYREFWALNDVSFDVRKGETIGIVGRNGSGKSTLLQIICGTLSQTAGEVSARGRVAALLELGAGFNPEFTGRENVYLNGSLLGLSRAQIDQRFSDIAAFADIGEFIEQPVKTYSSGMYVRLAFAVIAHVDADVLIIDEALAVGDVFFTQKCMRFLRKFMQCGTVLFVSHDTAAVQNLCDRALLMEQGEIRFIGTAKEVANRYLEALYASPQSPLPRPENVLLPPPPEDLPEDRDMRLDYINCSNLRNDLEVFRFEPEAASFGEAGGRIVSAQIVDRQGRPLTWIVGGEAVVLHVQCIALAAMYSPILGFFVRDRLGQPLFGDNTYLSYREHPLSLQAGETLNARFEFRMPVLPVGDYSVTLALAEGTQHEHVQHHWLHEALVFKSHSSSLCQGLVGIPMTNIQMYQTDR